MFWLRVAGNLRVLVLVKNGFGYWNVPPLYLMQCYERWTCLACFLGVFEISAVFFFYHFFFWVFALLGIPWRSAIAEYISLVAFFDIRIIRSLFSGFAILPSTSRSRMCFKIIESLQSRRISVTQSGSFSEVRCPWKGRTIVHSVLVWLTCSVRYFSVEITQVLHLVSVTYSCFQVNWTLLDGLTRLCLCSVPWFQWQKAASTVRPLSLEMVKYKVLST